MINDGSKLLEELVEELHSLLGKLEEETEHKEVIPKPGDLVIAKDTAPYNITTKGVMALGVFLEEDHADYRDVSGDALYEYGDIPLKVLLVNDYDEFGTKLEEVYGVNPKHFIKIGESEFHDIIEELFDGYFETTESGEFRDLREGTKVEISADLDVAEMGDPYFLEAHADDGSDFDWYKQSGLKKFEEKSEDISEVEPGDLVMPKDDNPYGITCKGVMALGLFLKETHDGWRDVRQSFEYSRGDEPLKILLLEDEGDDYQEHVFSVHPKHFEKVDREMFEEITSRYEENRFKTTTDGEFYDIEEGEVVTVTASYAVAENGDPYFLRAENSEGEYDYFRPQDLVETNEEFGEEDIKVGDYVKAKEPNPYSITNSSMKLGKVLSISGPVMYLEVVEHEESHRVGKKYNVKTKYFHKVTGIQEGDIVRYSDADWFGNEGLGEVIGFSSTSGNPLVKAVSDNGTTEEYYIDRYKVKLVAKKSGRLDK